MHILVLLHTTYTFTHTSWIENEMQLCSCQQIWLNLVCHQRNNPQMLLLARLHSQLTEGDCGEQTDERDCMCEYDSASLWSTLPPHKICGWKRSYAMSWKITMLLRVNKSSGGMVLCPLPLCYPDPRETALMSTPGLFVQMWDSWTKRASKATLNYTPFPL